MTPDFWHARWQRGEIGWHLDEIHLGLQAHWPRLGVGTSGRVLVPLCGKSMDLLWLASQGHRVLGVELSPIAVEALFREQGLIPEVTEEPPFRRYRVGRQIHHDIRLNFPAALGPVHRRRSILGIAFRDSRVSPLRERVNLALL